MNFATKRQMDQAAKLDIDVVGMSQFEAKEAIRYELMRRRSLAMKALEKAGFKIGVICLYGGRKVRVEKFFDHNPHSMDYKQSPQVVTRDVETDRGVCPYATSVELFDEKGEVLPVNLWEIWSSHFPKWEESE